MKLTIFTPVFNREKLIRRLYESLLNQEFKDFEWLIVDDGSTDETKKIIEKIIDKKEITVRYFYKENGGKHSAYNLAIDKANGELFIIIDSDDIVLKSGIKEIIEKWEKLENKNELLGISGIDLDSDEKIIGGYYPKNNMQCSHLTIREIYKVKGDKSEIYRTEILKGNYFPIYNDEKFLTEAILFDKLYKNYDTYFMNIPLIIRDYQKNGLSDNSLKLRINSPIGAMNYYKQNKNICLTRIKKIKSSINYIRFYLHTKKISNEKLEINLFEKLFYPIGYLYYLVDRKKKI